MSLSEIAARYRRFAAKEAAGHSPFYEAAALAVAKDKGLLAKLATLPEGKQQPNLLFASLRHRFGLADEVASFLAPTREAWPEVSTVMLARSTQTNEPGRCATLLPLLARLPQPLALLEVGASAGLCLLPDRYGYDYRIGEARYRLLPPDAGPDTPIFPCEVSPDTPLPESLPQVVWRAGLDLNPLDLGDRASAAWLETLVWPEQRARAQGLRQAIAVAREKPPRVIAGDLNRDLAALAAEAPGDATLVIFHSAVLAYLSQEDRQRFRKEVQAMDATWISNEAESVLGVKAPASAQDDLLFVTLQDTIPVARADPHGRRLHWIAGEP